MAASSLGLTDQRVPLAKHGGGDRKPHEASEHAQSQNPTGTGVHPQIPGSGSEPPVRMMSPVSSFTTNAA